jgi:serine phosphatase RsbU (regulator of sigma subunit)
MEPSAHVMACMEVWGGNRAFDGSVVMAGLDAWVHSRPYKAEGPDAAGGDIHFVTSCATGRITRLVVADVSGHGAPVARAGDALRRLVRRHSNYVDQTRLVEAVNREFGQIAEETGDAGAMFATAVVATYFAPTDELTVANAGHPRPVRFDAERGEWSRLEPPEARGPANLPLGIDDGAAFPGSTLRLGRGDLVLFFSDSLVEARMGGGRLLGQDGLLEVLRSVDAAGADALVPSLLGAIRERSGVHDPFDDDVTVLLVRRNEHKPEPSAALGFTAGARIIRDAVKALRPGALPASFPEISLRSLGGAMIDRLNRH